MKKLKENILSWCENVEEETLNQALNVSTHPKLVGNFCLMPDCHKGYGMPIGGVAALKDAISPNMVGVDIGCGMLAIKTNIKNIKTEDVKKIFSDIRKNIPLGKNHHPKPVENEIFEDDERWQACPICKKEKKSARRQIGTLGGGNHFIEIQLDEEKVVWFMIHSGSRNLGYKVATFYNQKAEESCNSLNMSNFAEKELAFLQKETEEFNNYLKEMQLCLDFAYENRKEMSKKIQESFKEILPDVKFEKEINIHHNYVALEKHNGIDVWVHRKGATLATQNTIGIIPGSQGSNSYIVQGLGNEASLNSCSHGAGRKLSRKDACNQLSIEEECKKLEGIVHSIRHINDLEEAPSAYKDIDTVMEEQKDLVKILIKLKPIAVIKG